METTRSGHGADESLAAMLSDVARTLQAEPDVEATLQAVTRTAASARVCNAARITAHTPARCQRRNKP
ncbi:hypothetical protein [Amycolatopsis sp. Hca4]|uniref:hypothetical protein n=1 Tax=Amycolatopsis sp. Hca4 TaxID=2742131 RepID=UPI001591EDA3|nr:hypothetical protein [Amycolatopsis sp. Hca4]QKV74080.1 hypothetical protein HUT10_10070 [Amycolatopsis sp. Hca4]